MTAGIEFAAPQQVNKTFSRIDCCHFSRSISAEQQSTMCFFFNFFAMSYDSNNTRIGEFSSLEIRSDELISLPENCRSFASSGLLSSSLNIDIPHILLGETYNIIIKWRMLLVLDYFMLRRWYFFIVSFLSSREFLYFSLFVANLLSLFEGFWNEHTHNFWRI